MSFLVSLAIWVSGGWGDDIGAVAGGFHDGAGDVGGIRLRVGEVFYVAKGNGADLILVEFGMLACDARYGTAGWIGGAIGEGDGVGREIDEFHGQGSFVYG